MQFLYKISYSSLWCSPGICSRPLLFSIYILPIHDIIGQFPDVHYHIYTDDIHLYSFLPNSSNVLPDNSQLCKCASTIRSWLLSNNLLLNSSKSALLNIPSTYHYFPPVIIDGLHIIPLSSVINLGITLDANLSLNSHIANISKSANYHLFKIRRIRKDLTRPLTTVLINALVLSRIDYCSSLLYHLPNTSLSPLNRIIRASIRTIFSINRFDHSITDSHQLISNWFPQKKRSLLLAHKAIYYTSPPYLTSLLTLRRPLTSLRSNADISLICPRVSYLKYHKRAFSYMIPSLWNSLPASIRSLHSYPSFITHLKAYISSM